MDDPNIQNKYCAMIWNEDNKGIRVSIYADNVLTAKSLLEEEYGKGNIFNLHNPQEAENPR